MTCARVFMRSRGSRRLSASRVLRSGNCCGPSCRSREGTARPKGSADPLRFQNPPSAASPIGSDPLIGNPYPLGRVAALPEHVDRYAAAREPVAADSKPLRLEQADEVLPDAHGAILVERAVIAEASKVKFQRLRFDDP